MSTNLLLSKGRASFGKIISMHSLRRYQVVCVLFLAVVVTACSTVAEPTIVILPTATHLFQTDTPSLPRETLQPAQENNIPDVDKFQSRVEISFWYPWAGEDAKIIEGMVNEFNASNSWNVQVNAFQNGDENYLAEKVVASLKAENKPTIIAAQMNFLRSLYLNGNELLNLSAYVRHSKWGISEQDQVSYPLTFWQQDLVEDFRFGMPAQRNAHLIFYNQSWAKELGFKAPPATPDDFLNQACAAARQNSFDRVAENDGTGGWIFNSQPTTVLSWMKSFGGGEMPITEKEKYKVQNNDNEKAFTFLQQMVRLSCAWIARDQDPYQYFATRKALFYSGTLKDIQNQKKIFTKDDWTIVPYPSLDGHEVVLSDGLSYAVIKSDSNRNLAAWLFIRWMQKPENQAKMIIETSTYSLTSTASGELTSFSQKNPAWKKALQFLPQVKSIPLIESWLDAGKVLQDAAWQVVQSNIKPGDVSGILIAADKLIGEMGIH